MTGAEAVYSSHIANCVFNAFLSYTAIMLNSVTIYAVRKTSSLPKPLKILLLSLAVSDLGVGLIVQPLYSARLIIRLEPNYENNPAYKATYYLFLFPYNLLYFASFFGVTALTVDRFLAIHLHLRYQELVTHKRVVAAVISVWVLSAVSLIGLFMLQVGKEGTRVTFAIIMIGCLVATAVLYYKIYLAVRRHTNQIHALQVQQEAQSGEMANAARLRKSAVGTFYVYLVFLVCYLPDICIYVASIISGYSKVAVLSRYTTTLVFLNSSLNPLIYCWKMSQIRRAVTDILRKIMPSRNWEKLLLRRNLIVLRYDFSPLSSVHLLQIRFSWKLINRQHEHVLVKQFSIVLHGQVERHVKSVLVRHMFSLQLTLLQLYLVWDSHCLGACKTKQ